MYNSKPFHFKQFSVRHDLASMKVGTDAVLLGVWVELKEAKHILDVGTGCGIIALMLAQRSHNDVLIEGLDIDEPSLRQAHENGVRTPWRHRLQFHLSSLQEYKPVHQYDLIVCNPPYFTNSLLPPGVKRKQARHTGTLSFTELITFSKKMLTHNGRLVLILPTAEGTAFKELAIDSQLYLSKETAVFTKPGKPQERWLLEFSLSSGKVTTGKIVLFEVNGNKTQAYQELTNEFYL
ncbi:MAG: methyltransferase [Bacteroidetes bacterium]|nr:methyltransferase [Bacteroidota bacterium]